MDLLPEWPVEPDLPPASRQAPVRTEVQCRAAPAAGCSSPEFRIALSDLSPEQCDDLLDMVSIGEILQKGAEAIAAGFGELEELEGQRGYPFARK